MEGNPDFVKLAESFGAKGYRVEQTEDFQPLLERLAGETGVHIIDLPIDYSENSTLIGDNLKARTS
jgi:acetolactate synthase-1/2/3 large subunit